MIAFDFSRAENYHRAARQQSFHLLLAAESQLKGNEKLTSPKNHATK